MRETAEHRPADTLLTSWIEETVRELQRAQSELQDTEAKRAGQDLPRRLYRTLSAFGNRAGGGIILLGVDEAKQFQVSGVDDPAKAQHDLVSFVQNEMSYPLRLETTLAQVDGKTVVAITVMEAPYTQKPVYYKPLGLDKGSYYRSSTSNVQMTPEQVRELIRAQVELREDFSARLISTLPDDWYDPLEVERLRQVIRAARPGSDLHQLPDNELMLKLQLAEHTGQRVAPCITGLLLIGREQCLSKHVPEHEIILLNHPEGHEEYDRRLDLKRPLLSAMEQLEAALAASNRIIAVQVGAYRYEIPRLHPKVYREALLNAIIHRSYADYGSVFVRLHPDRLCITNPGGFLPGVSPQNLLTGAPRQRNRRLAEVFQILGLVERAGMGVRKMYRYQLEGGKLPPEYESSEAHVQVSIPTDHIDEKMAAFVASRYRAGFKFDIGDLLVLSRLRSVPEIRSVEVAELTRRGPRAASDLLQQMVNKDLLRRRGQGTGTTYRLAPSLSQELGTAPKAARDSSIDSIRHPEMIQQYIRQHTKITTRECEVLCDLTKWQASKLLRKLRDSGVLESRGVSSKLTYYVLAEQESGE